MYKTIKQSGDLNNHNIEVIDKESCNRQVKGNNQDSICYPKKGRDFQDDYYNQSLLKRQNNNFHYYQSLQANQGLPNVGNTCFLNSAIQFLYSSLTFRDHVYQTKVFPNSFEQNFKNIIESIQNKRNYGLKYILMKQLTQKLRQMKTNYNQFSQQDSLQFIFLILNQLSINNPAIKKNFGVYYKAICSLQTCKNELKYNQYALIDSLIQCEKCHSNMNIKFINSPKCIILQICQKANNYIYFSTLKNQTLSYKLKAKLIYSGNGKSGHYKLSRRINDTSETFYSFSDAFIHQQWDQFQPSFYRKSNYTTFYQNNDYSYTYNNQNHYNYFQKCLLALYELEKQQKSQPLQILRNNNNLLKRQQVYQKNNNLKQQQIQRNYNNHLNQQQIHAKKTKYVQKISRLNLQPCQVQDIVQNIQKSHYIYLKNMVQFLYYSKIFKLSVIDNIRVSIKTIQSIFKTIFMQLQFNKNQRNEIISQNIAKLATILNQASLSNNSRKKKKLCPISQTNINNLKTISSPKVISINLMQILIKQLANQNSSMDFFYFQFSYECHCSFQNKNNYYQGYIFPKSSDLCCKKPLQFQYVRLIKRPKCLIFQDTKSTDNFKKLKTSNQNQIAKYEFKKRYIFQENLFLYLYDFNCLDYYPKAINNKNNNIKTYNEKQEIELKQAIKQNTNNIKCQSSSIKEQQTKSQQLFQFIIEIPNEKFSQKILVNGFRKLYQILQERNFYNSQYVRKWSNNKYFQIYINSQMRYYRDWKNHTIFCIHKVFKLRGKKQNSNSPNTIRLI